MKDIIEIDYNLILNRTIEFQRLIMYRLAERLGRENPLVIAQSVRVDGLVMEVQRDKARITI